MPDNVHQPHTVYVRSNWADAWQAVPYLYANSFSFACGPDTADATLQYDFGRKIRPDVPAWANYSTLDITDKYVKIVVDGGGPTWYGVCVETEEPRDGGHDVGGAEVVSGSLLYLCRGLEYLLQRKPITTSWVEDENSNIGETEIGRAIGFNLGAGLPSSGLREPNRGPIGIKPGAAHIFPQTLQDAQEWTAADILEYLCAYHSPVDRFGVVKLPFVATPNALNVLVNYKPTLQIEGKSFFQILNELIDRRRLMSWRLFVEPILESRVFIEVFTFNSAAIALPDGSFIPANTDQVANWDFDQENQVQACILASDDANKFNRVLAKGEPPGSVFTVSIQNGLLETDWTTAQKTLYDDGDPDAATRTDDWSRHNYHQAARAKDFLKKVYRYFRISPTGFTGMIGGSAVWPLDNVNTNVPLSFWWPGLRLQDRLPLRTEHDYEDTDTITNQQKQNSKWEYRRPFAYIKESGAKAYFLDRHGRGEDIDTHIEASGRFWAASLRMQDDAFGIIVDVHGGPQHMIAKNAFVAADAADETDYTPDADYSYLYATVFAEGDGHIQVQWPPQAAIVAAGDQLKDLIIRCPNCRLDYIVPGTTVDIDTNGDEIQSLGGFIQDDTPYMLNVARSAYEWYSIPRKAMQVTIHDLSIVRSVGELILLIGGNDNTLTANSVVTKVTYDTQAGTATILTQFAELDLS